MPNPAKAKGAKYEIDVERLCHANGWPKAKRTRAGRREDEGGPQMFSDAAVQRYRSRVRVNPDTGCHEWTLTGDKHGYGRVSADGGQYLAHRFAWMVAHNRPVPRGLVVCHRCDNPPCCNHEHLFVGTQADNLHDMFTKGRRPTSYGVRTSNGSLTDGQVAEIRRRFVPGKKPGRGYPTNAPAPAREFGITPEYVHQLVKGHWRNCA